MNNFKRIFFILAAVALAGFALPSFAGGNTATKFFSAQFPLLIAGGTTTIQVAFNNATPPPGVSTINSIKITTPNAGVTINTGSSSPGTWTLLGQDPGGGWIYEANNFTGIRNGQTGTFTVSITSPANACVSGTWQAAANTGNSLNGDMFNDNGTGNLVSRCDGILNCGDDVGTPDPQLNGTVAFELFRGQNIDNGTCSPLPYLFSITSGTQTTDFLVLKNGQQVSAEYIMAWAPTALPADGWASFRPSVSWGAVGHNPPVTGTSDYVPALACLSDDLTHPAAIMPTIPNLAPYNSSPYTQFQPGQVAKMCIAEQQWALVNVGTVAVPVWQIQYLDVVIDQSDGWVKGP